MAYVSNMDEEDENKNQSQGAVSPVGGQGTVHVTPSSGVASPVGQSGASGTPAGTEAAGGDFATLDKYVGANLENAAPLANQITGTIQNQYNSLNQQNQDIASGVQSQVTGGYTPNSPDVLAQEASNPVSFASDQGNIGKFQSLLNDQYVGPSSAESTSDFQNQQANINNAIAAGNASTQTETGREGLLQAQEATPTTSVTALNQAILSQNPDYLGQVEHAYDPFSNLLSGLNTSAQGIDTSIGQAQADTSAASTAANKAIADQTSALNNQLNQELTDSQGNITNYNQDVSTMQSAANNYNKDIQAFLAANPNVQAPTNADLSTWLNLQTDANSPTIQQVATPQDYATAAALQSLNGTNPVTTNINASTVDQAGTALPPNFQSILDALSNNSVSTAMTNEVQGLGNQITSAYQPLQNAETAAYNYNVNGIPAQDQLTSLQTQLNGDPMSSNNQLGLIGQLNALKQSMIDAPSAGQQDQLTALQTQITDVNNQIAQQQAIVNANPFASWDAVGPLGQSLQWLPQTGTNFNNLISQLNADLAPVQGINIPTPATFSSDNGAATAEKAVDIGTAGLAAPTMAAVNSLAANPSMDAERAALFFPTFGASLILPQSTLNTIGNDIHNVVNSIGDFFGNLF